MISIEEIEEITKRLKLQLSEKEKKFFLKNFEKIVQYIVQVKEIQIPENIIYKIKTINKKDLRKDIPQAPMDIQKVLQNTDNTEDGYFKVPNVLE